MLAEPLPLSPFQELSLLQPPGHGEIDSLQGGGEVESWACLSRRCRRWCCRLRLLHAPPSEQSDSSKVRSWDMVGVSLLLLPGFQQANEFEGFQLV